jgi:hypothetical protein
MAKIDALEKATVAQLRALRMDLAVKFAAARMRRDHSSVGESVDQGIEAADLMLEKLGVREQVERSIEGLREKIAGARAARAKLDPK